MSQPAQGTLAMLERRRIETEILKHVYETLEEHHGAQEAAHVIARSVRASAIEQGRRMAAAVDGKTSMQTFVDRQALWTKGGALEITVREKTDTVYRFDVTRCQFAEMYREMGLGEIGHLLSCQRDATFCEGYDPRLRLERTQTIMTGATHCDFCYRLEEPATGAGAGADVEPGGD